MDELIPIEPFWGYDPVPSNWPDWPNYIVPVDESSRSRTPEATTNRSPSYETPPWIDTINRAIERAAQVATLEVAGYPPYPNYPLPIPQQQQQLTPQLGPGIQPQPPGQGVNLSNTTLMLLVGGVLLFMLGKRGR